MTCIFQTFRGKKRGTFKTDYKSNPPKRVLKSAFNTDMQYNRNPDNCRDEGGVSRGFDTGTEFAGSAGTDTGQGVSQWQERRHTLKKIEKLLLRSKSNTEGIAVIDNNDSIGAGKRFISHTMFAHNK